MNLKKPCILLGLLASLYVASCGGDEDASQSSTGTVAPLENACPKVCEVSGKLDCEGDVNQACSSCELVRTSVPWCEAQSNTYWGCVAADEANFVCGGGTGILWKKEEVCLPEFQTFSLCACVGEGASAMPDPKTVCAAYCGKQAGLPCASATCEEDCLAKASPNAFTGPGTLALYACVAEDPDSGFECAGSGGLLPAYGAECSYKTFNVNLCVSIAKSACEDLCVAECGETMCKDLTLPMSDACRACVLTVPPNQ